MDPRELTQGVTDIVSLPDACIRLNDMLDDPETTAADIGEVLAQDPGLTSRLLRLVNSAHYGLPGKVDTVTRAVTLIGLDEVRNIVLATSALNAFKKLETSLVDMDTFWNHSMQCGLTAKVLAERGHRRLRERVFVAGLLHAVGQLVMYRQAPEASREVLRRLAGGATRRWQIEREVFGCDHAQVGGELLRQWRLPESLWEPVECHPEPSRAKHHPVETALVHIGAAVAEVMEPGVKRADGTPLPPLELAEGVWTLAEVDDGTLPDALSEVGARWFDVLEVLSPGGSMIY